MGLLVQQGCWSLVSLASVSTLRGQWPLRDGNCLFLATEKKTRISLSPQRLCLLRPVLGPVHGTPRPLSFTGYHLVSTYSKPSVLYSFSLIFFTAELKSVLLTRKWRSERGNGPLSWSHIQVDSPEWGLGRCLHNFCPRDCHYNKMPSPKPIHYLETVATVLARSI